MVIITDCAYRSAIGAIHALKGINEDIICVTTDNFPKPPAFRSKHVKKSCVLPSDKVLYKDALIKLCREYQRPVVLPIGVFTLNIISEHKEEFKEVCDFCVSNAQTLETLNNKSKTKKLAESVNIKVPENYADNVSFPAVIKPLCGEKFGLKAQDRYKIVKNEDDLNKAKEIFSFSDTVIEEYVDGNGVGISVVMKNNKAYSAFCHRRLAEYPALGGPSTLLETFINNELIEKSINLLKQVDFSGIAMVEFKEKNGEFYFLEVNPRIWGSFSATAKAGSNFLEAYVCASRDKNYDFLVKYKANKKIKFVPNIFASVISYIKVKNYKKAFKTSICAISPFIPNAIFEFTDPIPALADIFRKRR